jgi:hypothetical protein
MPRKYSLHISLTLDDDVPSLEQAVIDYLDPAFETVEYENGRAVYLNLNSAITETVAAHKYFLIRVFDLDEYNMEEFLSREDGEEWEFKADEMFLIDTSTRKIIMQRKIIHY